METRKKREARRAKTAARKARQAEEAERRLQQTPKIDPKAMADIVMRASMQASFQAILSETHHGYRDGVSVYRMPEDVNQPEKVFITDEPQTVVHAWLQVIKAQEPPPQEDRIEVVDVEGA